MPRRYYFVMRTDNTRLKKYTIDADVDSAITAVGSPNDSNFIGKNKKVEKCFHGVQHASANLENPLEVIFQ